MYVRMYVVACLPYIYVCAYANMCSVSEADDRELPVHNEPCGSAAERVGRALDAEPAVGDGRPGPPPVTTPRGRTRARRQPEARLGSTGTRKR